VLLDTARQAHDEGLELVRAAVLYVLEFAHVEGFGDVWGAGARAGAREG
jgi:hypothetical protein